MSKRLIILADTDENYLVPLELKLFQELGNQIEVEIITEPAYFQSFFSKLRKADVLFISEELYDRTIEKHNINHIFVFQETMDFSKTDALNVHRVYKYTSVKEIFNEMQYVCSREALFGRQPENTTQVIVLYSPTGGCGKTALALGMAACLEENYKKVLYIDAEYLQTFQRWLSSAEPLPDSAYDGMIQAKEHLYEELKHFIRKERFEYWPPFHGALSSLNIDFSFFEKFIRGAKMSGDYDYIIVDTDSSYSKEKAVLLNAADKVLLIYRQKDRDVYNMDALIKNMNISAKDKFFMVCNEYSDANEKGSSYMTSGYVEKYPEGEAENLETLLKIEGLRKLAYSLI